MDTLEVLQKARALIEKPEDWAQGVDNIKLRAVPTCASVAMNIAACGQSTLAANAVFRSANGIFCKLRGNEMTPAVQVLQKILAAYGNQRDPIGDSDLDNEQPISLHVHITLGEIRRVRDAVVRAGHYPADFNTKPIGESR
jgi:hypothetical protein